MNATAVVALLLAVTSQTCVGNRLHRHDRLDYRAIKQERQTNDILEWLADIEPEGYRLSRKSALLSWTVGMNNTEENAAKLEKFDDIMLEWSKKTTKTAKEFNKTITSELPEFARRYPNEAHQIATLGIDFSEQDEVQRKRNRNISITMSDLNTASMASYRNGTWISMSDAMKAMESERNADELLHLWTTYHDNATVGLADLFEELIESKNKNAKQYGFRDAGDLEQLSDFGDPYFVEKTQVLLKQMETVHKLLHAFIRQRLSKFYGEDKMPSDGTIPAHLTGNLWGQSFAALGSSILSPFPDIDTSFEPQLKKKFSSTKEMAKEAEKFFVSLGLNAMPDPFWKHSVFVDPHKPIDCYPHADDLNGFPEKQGDVRIVVCGELNEYYYEVFHHEMGHCQYYLLYKQQPLVFRDGANAGFHEAIGDTVALSAYSYAHAKKIGLVDRRQRLHRSVYEKKLINRIMSTMLEKVPVATWAHTLSLWRYRVYSGEITRENYNTEFWAMRKKYEGISPGEPRSPDSFDAGAKMHIAQWVPYLRYFFSMLSQFQFHEHLCKRSGHTGLLAECDIFGSEKAGKILRDAMELGSSKPWPEVMQILAGARHLSSSSILEYYEPVITWLKETVDQESVGWDE